MLIDHLRSSRLLLSIVLASIAVLFFQSNVSAQNASFTRSDYPILGNNHIAADLNGDGLPDLAATGGNGVGIMLGNGDGTFRPRINFPTGAPSQDLAAGDFNGDGRMDLAVSLTSPEFSLALLKGNGDGTFTAPVMFDNTAAQDDSPAIVATDLDNDGRLDVVLAHALSCFVSPCAVARNITVMLGFGDGTFQTPFEIDVGTGMSRIAVGDFNSDGIKDLGIAGDQARVYLLLGIGNGSFLKQPAINLLTTGTIGVDGTDIDVADLNGDTIQDLVVAIALNGSRTAILLGNNDGTFQPAQIITEPRLRVPQYQVIADFNRDGFLDLALSLANGTEGLFEIRLGNGDGTFRAPVLYAAPPPLSSVGGGTIVTGDFNRDGRPDIALPITGANPALVGLVNSSGSVSVTPAYGSVTATPSTIASGASTEITISLTAGAVAPAGGFSFSVSSSNTTALTAPATVVMPAGASSVRFTATARNVTSTQTVNLTIRNDRLGRRDVPVTVTRAAPQPPSTDTIRITRAEYVSSRRSLRVEATSSNSGATLRVFVSSTGALLGTLSSSGGGQYRGEFSSSTNPRNITIRSSLGGVATANVSAK